MAKRRYFRLKHKDSQNGNKYDMFADFPYMSGLNPEMVVNFIGLADTYTAEEITEEEYLLNTSSNENNEESSL